MADFSQDVKTVLEGHEQWLGAHFSPQLRRVCDAPTKRERWYAARDLLDSDPLPIVPFDAFETQHALSSMLRHDANAWQASQVAHRLSRNEAVFNSVVSFARRTLRTF